MNRHSCSLRAVFARTLIAGLVILPSISIQAEAKRDPTRGTMTTTSVETEVKSALHMNLQITAPGAIDVQDQSGVIVLSGSVLDASEAQRAIEVARRVPGVREVKDRLTRKSEAKSYPD
jgi:osmotically-inducible protein OsmY